MESASPWPARVGLVGQSIDSVSGSGSPRVAAFPVLFAWLGRVTVYWPPAWTAKFVTAELFWFRKPVQRTKFGGGIPGVGIHESGPPGLNPPKIGRGALRGAS